MTKPEEPSLRELVAGLAEIHRRAGTAYREMVMHAGSERARCLLVRLAKREGRLAGEVAALADRIDPGVRVRRPSPILPELPSPPDDRLDVDTVIARATHLESAVENLLHAVATPPVGEPSLLVELFAIHRRELFGLGAEASRLRQSLE